MRISQYHRTTTETDIHLTLNLDGTGQSRISTGCGFLDHMLILFSRHGSFDLELQCTGDTHIDDHHTVEDIGISLGAAFGEALGSMGGIQRYGHTILPMDEALILCAVDLSGRSFLSLDYELTASKVGSFDTELVEEFFLGFVRKAGMTLHIRQLAGRNTHHIIEGTFKAFARAMTQAVRQDLERLDEIPSTKGVLL